VNIEHAVETTYEDLYDRDDAEEWMKIFKYHGRSPTQNFTVQDVTESFALAPTFQQDEEEEGAMDLMIAEDAEVQR